MQRRKDVNQHATPRVREIDVEMLVHATKLSVGKKENLEHYLKRLTHLTLNGDETMQLKKGVITKIQNLHHCPHLKVLYLYDNAIEKIENLQDVPELTHLHLQNNRIRKMENLEHLMQMEKLYLEGNGIERLEGLVNCIYLQELHLSNQTIPPGISFSFEEESMQSLARSLRILNLSNCHVTSTHNLLGLQSLEQLDLSKNDISEIDHVFALLSALSSLKELDLRGNPVTNGPKYREKAITFSSSRLALLDKKDVDPNQRRMMQQHLAHKYRKRQEASEIKSSMESEFTSTNETRRMVKHGSNMHQLRGKGFSSSSLTKKLKPQLEQGALGIAGASCSNVASTAVVRVSTNNNNKYH